MLENIELKINEIKDTCKKHGLKMDHFWVEVNRQFNLKQAKIQEKTEDENMNTMDRSLPCLNSGNM